MPLETWLTAKAIKGLFDLLEKGPVRVSGLDTQDRDLVIWATPKKEKKDEHISKGIRQNKKS